MNKFILVFSLVISFSLVAEDCPDGGLLVEYTSSVTNQKIKRCQIKKDGSYVNHGPVRTYDPSGKLVKEEFYKMGVLSSAQALEDAADAKAAAAIGEKISDADRKMKEGWSIAFAKDYFCALSPSGIHSCKYTPTVANKYKTKKIEAENPPFVPKKIVPTGYRDGHCAFEPEGKFACYQFSNTGTIKVFYHHNAKAKIKDLHRYGTLACVLKVDNSIACWHADRDGGLSGPIELNKDGTSEPIENLVVSQNLNQEIGQFKQENFVFALGKSGKLYNWYWSGDARNPKVPEPLPTKQTVETEVLFKKIGTAKEKDSNSNVCAMDAKFQFYCFDKKYQGYHVREMASPYKPKDAFIAKTGAFCYKTHIDRLACSHVKRYNLKTIYEFPLKAPKVDETDFHVARGFYCYQLGNNALHCAIKDNHNELIREERVSF